ncbi:MAG: beta-ketoacyl-ACP synthase [Myxococcales bacterium]|nr:beta-ketoacyl-ACP synthase [Myxococcales bacterium]
MRKRVVVTGMAGCSPLGNDWPTIERTLRTEQNCVRLMPEWDIYDGLHTRLGAPVAPLELPAHYDRKACRSMGRVAIMATRAAEQVVDHSGLRPLLPGLDGQVGVAFGSSTGEPAAVADFARMVLENSTRGINATTYIRMMSHTAPVNIAVFLGLTGRVITTSSACTSGSQGIGYAYEAIRHGLQSAMIAGGTEELHPTEAAVFDTLYATSTRNDEPHRTPRAFDAARDGLVLGEGAGALLLEAIEVAEGRGAPILAELVGFGTNCDGVHVTRPNAQTMQRAMELALADAGLRPEQIGYINAHGTATAAGDVAESRATYAVFGDRVPISGLKSYMGHTLGACGALEAWMTIEMMRTGWFSPNLNLDSVDPECAPLDYIRAGGREIDCEYVMSNNFAFGGINTSLIFRRVR